MSGSCSSFSHMAGNYLKDSWQRYTVHSSASESTGYHTEKPSLRIIVFPLIRHWFINFSQTTLAEEHTLLIMWRFISTDLNVTLTLTHLNPFSVDLWSVLMEAFDSDNSSILMQFPYGIKACHHIYQSVLSYPWQLHRLLQWRHLSHNRYAAIIVFIFFWYARSHPTQPQSQGHLKS